MKCMTSHRAAFYIYEVIAPYNVYLGDNSIIELIGMGSIIVEPLVTSKIKKICIKDAFHVSKLQANLLSGSKVLSNMLKVQFTQF